MLNFLQKTYKKHAFITFGIFALLIGVANVSEGTPMQLAPQSKNPQNESAKSWKKFHSISGNCLLSLPASPEHVKQIMPFPKEGYNLRYDVYISAHENRAVYILLVAPYPPSVNKSYAKTGLERFLNGLLSQHHDNNLIFADLVDVQGHTALDFFIESKGIYFKGRAIMAENTLYLLAMECSAVNYLEHNFNHFINSFELVKQ